MLGALLKGSLRLVAVFIHVPFSIISVMPHNSTGKTCTFSIPPVLPTVFLQSLLYNKWRACVFSVSQRSHPCGVSSQTRIQICAQPQVDTQTNHVPILRKPSTFVVRDWYSKHALYSSTVTGRLQWAEMNRGVTEESSNIQRLCCLRRCLSNKALEMEKAQE